METILNDIKSTSGVAGVFLCGLDGSVIHASVPAVLDSATLTSVARGLIKTMEGLKMARRKKVVELDLLFHDGRLIVKNLGAGCLVILCTPSINVPLLNLTANVATKKLSGLLAERAAASAAAPVAVTAAPPATVVSAGKVPLAQQLRSIVQEYLGEDGLELFDREMKMSRLDDSATAMDMAGIVAAIDYAAGLAVGGRRANELKSRLQEAIKRK